LEDEAVEGFTNKQIAEKTGLSPRLIQFYTLEGVVTPEINAGKGRGRVRRYSEKNLFEFALVSELSTYGIKIMAIRHIIQGLDLTERQDFFETLEMTKPFLILKIRDESEEFGEVKPEMWMGNSNEGFSGGTLLPMLFENSVSVLVIDLYSLHKRRCLGIFPKTIRFDDLDDIKDPESAELAKLAIKFSKFPSKDIRDVMIQFLKSQYRSQKK
jgi:DNA-binding transcriptional MerR regulator